MATKCFCGCGREVPDSLLEINQAGDEIGLELVEWRKIADSGVKSHELADLVETGESAFRVAMNAVHDEEPPSGKERRAIVGWTKLSMKARARAG